MGKKLLKIAGILPGILVVLTVVATIVLRIMFPPEKIKALVLPQIEKAVGRQVKVEKVRFSVFPIFGARISGLEIANTKRPGFSKEPFLTLGDFVLKVKIPPLLRKKLKIAGIVLRKPNILVEVDQEGAFNFDDLAFMQEDTTKPPPEPEKKESGPPALPVPLTLEKFAIQDAHVVYVDKQAKQKVEIGNIDQRVDFDIDKALKNVKSTGELKVTDISLQSADIPTPLSGVTVTFNHNIQVNVVDGVLKINEIRASLQKVFLSLKGTVKNFNDVPVLNLAVKTDKIMFADLLAEVPSALFADIKKLKATGYTQLQAQVKGKLDSASLPKVKGVLKIAKVQIQYTDLPKAVNDFNADIRFTENTVDIKTLKLKLGQDPVSVVAALRDIQSPTPRIANAAILAKVNLADLKNVVELPEGTAVSGKVMADIKAKGIADPADPTKLALNGTIKLSNVKTKIPELTKPVVLHGVVKLTNRQIAERLKVVIGKSSVNLDAKVIDFLPLVLPDSTRKMPRTKVQFSVVSPLMNTDEFLPKTETAAKDKEPAAETEATGDEPLIPMPLPGVDVNGSIAFHRTIYQGIALTNHKTTIISLNDVLTMSTRANLFKGRIEHDLRVDARNTQDLQVKNVLNVNNVQVEKFLTDCGKLLPDEPKIMAKVKALKGVTGAMTLKTDIATHGSTQNQVIQNLDGNVLVTLANGKISQGQVLGRLAGVVGKFYKIKEVTYRDLWLDGHVRDGNFVVDSFMISSAKLGDYNLQGKVGLLDTKLDLTLANRLTPTMSKPIVGLQSKGKAALKGLLSQVGAGAVAGMADGVGIPVDGQGRVTLLLGLGGTLDDPKWGFKGFSKGTGKPAQKTSPKQDIKKRAAEELAKKKAEAKARLDAERKRAEQAALQKKKEAEAQARAQAEAQRKKVEAEKKAAAEKAKKEAEAKKKAAADAAKKKLKKFGL